MKMWDAKNLHEITQFEDRKFGDDTPSKLDYILGSIDQSSYRKLRIVTEPFKFKNEGEKELRALINYQKYFKKLDATLEDVKETPIGVSGYAAFFNRS